jgi:hypothetical protein
MILIDGNTTHTVNLVKHFLPDDEQNLFLSQDEFISWASDNFNDVFTDSGLWEKYQAYNLSFAKYQNTDGWANALFSHFNYTRTDMKNFVSWVKLILEDEYFVIA